MTRVTLLMLPTLYVQDRNWKITSLGTTSAMRQAERGEGDTRILVLHEHVESEWRRWRGVGGKGTGQEGVEEGRGAQWIDNVDAASMHGLSTQAAPDRV